jgi:catechol 2,3-dioxygenase-like lactoylglutathione lyase family enzyme
LIRTHRVDFIAVPVEDLARADAFYGETLGLARNPHTSGEKWVEYETGNLTIALSPYGGVLALGVPDVSEARGELEQEGVQFSVDTFDSGVCHGAPLADPDGNPIQLHRRYAPLERFDVPVQEVQRTRLHRGERTGSGSSFGVLRRNARPETERARERRVAGVRGGERGRRAQHA